jgi:ribosomal protein S18 acetylase RimI-like enzyme
MSDYITRHFTPADQPAMRALILDGLASRFGFADESLTPDLDDIHSHYAGETILVVEDQGSLVACGILRRENRSDDSARLVRVSVHRDYQGKGLGKRISQQLIEAARARGFRRVLCETNSDWESALRLYRSLGFRETHRQYDARFDFTEVHMALDVT